MCLDFGVEHGADEGGELEVTLGFSCGFVDGGLRVGVSATDIWELPLIAGLEVVVELQGFFRRVVVGDVACRFDDTLHLGFGAAFLGREVGVQARAFDALRLSGLENLRGAMARLLPAVLVLQLLALRRVFLEVARAADSICLLLAFKDDSAAIVAVLLLTADNAVLLNRSVDLIKRNL